MNPYICHVIFFIVLDLRLTKVGVQRYSFFYAHTLTVVIWKLYKSLISVFLTGKDSKNQTNRLFHFCTLLLQTDSINQHLTKEKCTKIKLYKIAFRYQAIWKGRKTVDELTRGQGAAQCSYAAWNLVPLLTRQLSLKTEKKIHQT